MSVGGRIIEMVEKTMIAGPYPGTPTDVVRLHVMDSNGDETCVYAEKSPVMPRMGESIWWQSGQIMFDSDKQSVRKVGYSFEPGGDLEGRNED